MIVLLALAIWTERFAPASLLVRQKRCLQVEMFVDNRL